MSQIDDFLSDKPSSQPKSGGDIDSFLSDAPKSYGLKDFGGDLASVVTKGVMAVPQAAVGLADIATGGRAGKALEDAGVRFKEANQIADSWKSDALKAQQKEFQDAEGIGGKAVAALSNPGLIASTVAESIPSMFLGGAVAKGAGLAIPALAGRAGLAAAGEGAVMAGSQAENIRQQTADGLLTPGQSALAAATGVAGGAIGALGAKAGKALGVGDIDTMIANGASQGAREGVGLAGRVGRGALAEGVLEELPQSLAETAFGNIALDKPVTEGMDEAAVLGTLSGGVMGGAAGAMSRPAKPSQQMGIDPGAGPLSRAAAASVDSAPPPQLGFSPLAGTPIIYPDGSVALNSEQEFQKRTGVGQGMDLSKIAQPSQSLAAEKKPAPAAPVSESQPPRVQVGQDPSSWANQNAQLYRNQSDKAGLTSEIEDLFAQGATAQQVLNAVKSRISFVPKEDQAGWVVGVRATLGIPSRIDADGAVEFNAWKAEYDKRKAASSTKTNAAETVPLEQRSLDELRQAFRSAQEPAIRKTIAAEIRKRRSAMPDPLAQPQQEIALEPQATEAVQSQPQEAPPAALGKPLTETGAGMLGRGADPLQSIIQGQADARRAADELRGATGASTVTGGDITPPGVESPLADVRSTGRNDDAGNAQPDANGVAGRAVGSTAESPAALRPEGWRTTAIKAGKVARSLGLDPKGKRLKEIVAEIDAKDGATQSDAPNNVVSLTDRLRDKVRDAAMEKATRQEIESQLAELSGLGRQNRVTMGDLARLREITENNTNGYNASSDLHQLLKTIRTRAAGNIQTETPANVQNAPQAANDGQAKASPVEARAPEGGNAAADTGVPAAGGNAGVRADGVDDLGPDTFAGSIKREMEARSAADERKARARKPSAPAEAQPEDVDSEVYRATSDGAGKFTLESDESTIAGNGDATPRKFASESDALAWAKENGFKTAAPGAGDVQADGVKAEKNAAPDAQAEKPAEPVNPEPSKAAQPKAEKPAEDDAFMGVKKDEPRNLVAMHNLTADNLLYADSIGGIPVPSIGITKIDSPFNGFGDVTLIAPSSMVDPEQGTPVFDRDAWTDRFPTMNFKKVKAKVADAFYERMKPVDGMGNDGGQFLSMLWEETRNASVQRPDKVADLFRRYNAPKMLYAKDVLGKEIKVPMRAAQLSSPAAEDKQLQAYWKKNGNRLIALDREMSGFDFSNSPEYKAFMAEIEGAVRRYAIANDKADRADSYVEMFLPDGQLGQGGFNRIRKDFEQVGKKEVDGVKLSEAVRKAVPDNDPAYDRWVKSLVEPLFEAPTITVRGREVEPTLENIVDAMTVGATAGAEKSLTFGPGKTAAMLGKRFKSMAEIKADRDRVVSQDQENEGKKATEELLNQYRAKATAFFKGTDWRGNIDTWAANDASMEALAKAGKAGGSNADIRQALVRAGFKQVDQATVDLASESIKALRTAATDYFEAKPQRAVKLSEFRAAVVPKGVSQEVKDVLTKNGIEVVEYNKKTEGARDAAIQKTAKRVDKAAKDILFMGDKAKAQRQGTSVDRAIMDMAGEGREANEILSFIAKSSRSPYRRQLAQKLLENGANPSVSIGSKLDGGKNFREGFFFIAQYSRKRHEITLSELATGKAEQAFLHEMAHAATLMALDKGGLIATQMNRLYESVKKQGGADGQYGMKNVGEFVAEAFTNPEFQQTLSGIQVSGVTVWERFVNMVRRAIGLPITYTDALSKSMELGAELMRENMPLRAAKSFRAEDGPAFAGEDAANFGIADAVEQIKQFDVKTAPKQTWAHYRGMSLQALGRRQLVDLYAEELPQLETYNDLVQQMDAEKNDTGAEADRVAQDWGSLKGGMDRKLAELMHDATLAKMDPDKPMPAGYFKRDYDALKSRFDALSPEAKTLYRKARDMYVYHYKAVQQAIKDRVERSEMSEGQKRKMMADLDDKLFKELKGVYFPLARFGQYVIVVKDANGEVVNVTRAETVKEAEQARKELQKAFPASSGNTVGKVLKQAEFNAGRDAVGKGFMADLMGALDEKGVDDELRDTVAQLYLSSLPDLSWAKHGIHRKGTPGFSQDARRAFAQNMFHGARYLAKLRHADRLQDLLIEMQDHIKAYEGVEEYDSVQAQQVVDEMVKRHEWLMNPKASPVSTALTSFGFLFHMGLSPASAMVNLTQTALVAYPQMGAKWGFARAGAALTKASEETVRAKNDLSQVLKGDELDAFNRAVKDGTIDVTMAHDLAGIAQGEDQGVMWKIRPVMRWASFMFHHAEKFNRQATFLAAYRLAKEANPAATQSQLYEQAKQATYDGHFDYSSSNRARIMQGNWQRVIFLFKNYAQHMVYALARNAYLSVKALDPKERSQARKTLGGILAAHAAAAGVLGLPIVGPLLTVASWIGGDDDEPWDAEVAMQNAMAEMIGPKAAEVVARGFSRLTPFDLSGRVALNKLILPDVQEGLDGKEWAESAMAAALGPVAGIGVNMARGAQKITEGDYMRGLEDMMPTALRGPLKAMRYASEGAVDKTGVTITEDVSTAGVIGQASGFSPSQVRRDTERRSAIYSYDRALLERRSVLMRMFAQAQMSGDLETAQEVREDIQRFNEKNPTRRITPMNLAASIRNRRKRIEEAEQGVYLPSKRRDALDAVSF